MSIHADDLLIFARVAECGSLSRAAEQLGLPKSSVSRRLSALENRLGERLLQRTTRRVILTDFGLAVLDHAQRVEEEVQSTERLAQHRQLQPSGVLRVSMPHDRSDLLLTRMLVDFASRYPLVTLELDLSARRVDLLGEGFDLAIRIGDLPADSTLTAKRLYPVSSGLYAAPSYLERRGMPRHPDDLLRHDALPLLRGAREIVPWTLSRGAEHWQGTPPPRATANSPALLVEFAHQGLGIVASPDDFIPASRQTGRLIRVLPDWCLPPTTAWAVFPSRRLMPTKTRAFLDLLESHFAHRSPVPSETVS